MSDDSSDKQHEYERFAEDLRDTLAIAAAAGTIGSPVQHQDLLKAILETAAHVCSAGAGSLFLIDRDNGDLFFEVAIGPKAKEVEHFRVPMGQGIAGLVAATGQAMAISDARNDPKVLDEIGDRIGHTPENIVCVPMFFDDSVIGVLELLDKSGGGSFSPADMDALALFARQAAIAIQLSRTYRHLGPFVAEILSSMGNVDEDRRASLTRRAGSFTEAVEGDSVFRRTMALAGLVHEIASRGEHEAEAVSEILRGFAGYLEASSGPELGL